MDIERIKELKQKLSEVQVMLQSCKEELQQEVADISAMYRELDGNDAHEVSLCGVRKALAKTERKTRWMIAMQNIERAIAANDYNIII